MQEIYYRRNDKSYFALAFPNNSGGYELRNPYFKGAAGSKDVTLLHSDDVQAQAIAVFEGFMDFLPAVVYTGGPPSIPVLVLNSVAMKDRAVAQIREMAVDSVHLYLDRDDAGYGLKQHIQAELPEIHVQDESTLYAGYKDFNAWLCAERCVTGRAA